MRKHKNKMKKVLVIDDDTFICDILKKLLENNKYMADKAYKGKTALELFRENNYDLVLCDYRLPDTSGLELMQKIRIIDHSIPIIIMTAYADVKMAVKLIKMGAADYITKPIQHEELVTLLNGLLGKPKEKSAKRKTNNFYTNGDFVIGESLQMKNVLGLAKKVAPTDMSVIISGETGVGKEYIARFIHEHSARKNKPFVAMDCGAIPKDLANSELFGHVKGSFTGAVMDKSGVFQEADCGTLFLDEIGNLSYDVQLKLLRSIQERVITRLGDNKQKKIDIRIIAATNEDLRNEVQKKSFREDLFHRLNEFNINIPPIRERAEDILVFVKHFIEMANYDLNKNVSGLSKNAETIILQYPWHGNLRELKNIVKRAVLITDTDQIDEQCFPSEITIPYGSIAEDAETNVELKSDSALKNASSEIEKQLIIKTIQEVGFNKSEAARVLKIDRKTLYNKIKLYNINI